MTEKYCINCKFCVTEKDCREGKLNYYCYSPHLFKSLITGRSEGVLCYNQRHWLNIHSKTCGREAKYYEEWLTTSNKEK